MAIAGVGGSVKQGSYTVANVGKWSISMKGESKDTTPFGATGAMRQRTGTITDWSAKFSGFADPTDTNGQIALYNGLTDTFTFKFYVNDTSYWQGDGVLAGLDTGTAADDVGTVDFSVDAAGAMVFHAS